MLVKGQNLPPPRTLRHIQMAIQNLQQQVRRQQKPHVATPTPVSPAQVLVKVSSVPVKVGIDGSTFSSGGVPGGDTGAGGGVTGGSFGGIGGF